MSDDQQSTREPQKQCNRVDRLGSEWANQIREHFDAQEELRRMRAREEIRLADERLVRFFNKSAINETKHK